MVYHVYHRNLCLRYLNIPSITADRSGITCGQYITAIEIYSSSGMMIIQSDVSSWHLVWFLAVGLGDWPEGLYNSFSTPCIISAWWIPVSAMSHVQFWANQILCDASAMDQIRKWYGFHFFQLIPFSSLNYSRCDRPGSLWLALVCDFVNLITTEN